jgi:2-oxoglutarate dehydrogenase E2 component (dihydrolipoamide succinyltransferase)
MDGEIKVPAMGESITEATVGAFLKKTGESVSADEEIIELETDKVNQVLYAPAAGVVTWNVGKDDVVKIGQVIGSIDSSKAPAKSSAVEKRPEVSAKESKEANVTLSDAASLIQERDTEKSSGGNARQTKDQYIKGLEEKKFTQPSQVSQPEFKQPSQSQSDCSTPC